MNEEEIIKDLYNLSKSYKYKFKKLEDLENITISKICYCKFCNNGYKEKLQNIKIKKDYHWFDNLNKNVNLKVINSYNQENMHFNLVLQNLYQRKKKNLTLKILICPIIIFNESGIPIYFINNTKTKYLKFWTRFEKLGFEDIKLIMGINEIDEYQVKEEADSYFQFLVKFRGDGKIIYYNEKDFYSNIIIKNKVNKIWKEILSIQRILVRKNIKYNKINIKFDLKVIKEKKKKIKIKFYLFDKAEKYIRSISNYYPKCSLNFISEKDEENICSILMRTNMKLYIEYLSFKIFFYCKLINNIKLTKFICDFYVYPYNEIYLNNINIFEYKEINLKRNKYKIEMDKSVFSKNIFKYKSENSDKIKILIKTVINKILFSFKLGSGKVPDFLNNPDKENNFETMIKSNFGIYIKKWLKTHKIKEDLVNLLYNKIKTKIPIIETNKYISINKINKKLINEYKQRKINTKRRLLKLKEVWYINKNKSWIEKKFIIKTNKNTSFIR